MNVEDSGWCIGIRWMKKWYVGRLFRIGLSILVEVWLGCCFDQQEVEVYYMDLFND